MPSELLQAYRHLLQPGWCALAVGDGEGRNGVWLAEQGLKVDAVDISAMALARARQLARTRGVKIKTECVDVLNWRWPKAQYDLVCSIYVHFPATDKQRMLRCMYTALRPGGYFFLEAFHADQVNMASGGPPDAGMLYRIRELAALFPEDRIIRLEKTSTRVIVSGDDQGEGRAVYLVIRKRARRRASSSALPKRKTTGSAEQH